jgi:AmiR/NasT family two-component response regulator
MNKPPSSASAAPLRILLVRDAFHSDEDDVSAIRSGLADAGYELVSVANADLNLPRLIKATEPDLLIIESEAAARSGRARVREHPACAAADRAVYRQ